MTMVTITLKDLKASEALVARAIRKAATQGSRLAEANAAVVAVRAAHAALVEQYGKQAVGGAP